MNVGITSENDGAEQLKIRITNQVFVWCVGLLLVMFLLSLIMEIPFLVKFVITTLFIVNTIAFILSYYNKQKLARHFVVMVLLTLIPINNLFFEGWTGGFILMMPAAAGIYYLFDYKYIRYYNIAYVVIFTILLTNIAFNAENYPEKHLLNSIIFSLSILFSMAVMNFSRRETDYYIQQSNEKQQIIDKAQNLANIGSWSFDYNTNQLFLSDQLYTILDLESTIPVNFENDLLSILPIHYQTLLKETLQQPPADNFRLETDITKVINEQRKILRFNVERVTTEENNYKLLGTFQDITTLKAKEAQIENLLSEVKNKNVQLERRSEALNQSNKELERFAYIASHDLQEPLRMVGNFVQLLEEEYKEKIDDEGKTYIQYAVNGVTRMSALIDDLLKYARVGRGETPIKVISVAELLQQVQEDLSVYIIKNKATINIGSIPNEIKCIPNLIRAVFINLISNGIKFNHSPNPQIEIWGEAQENGYQFAIRDNGIGISQNNQEGIFEIFKRLHRKEEYKGTGIGLALVQRIIHHHQGRIWIESELGQGSTFYFFLPKK